MNPSYPPKRCSASLPDRPLRALPSLLAALLLAACSAPPASPPPEHTALLVASASASPIAQPPASPTAAPSAASAAAAAPSATAVASQAATAPSVSALPQPPLPEEPWFADKEDRSEECLSPPATLATPVFPVPFERCEERSISYATPPPGPHLHFYYRSFSAALTTLRRKQEPGVCCYMIWAFPR